jgi:hypothetical protein
MTEAQPTHSFAALDAIAKSLLNSRAVIGRRASSRILSIVSIFESDPCFFYCSSVAR